MSRHKLTQSKAEGGVGLRSRSGLSLVLAMMAVVILVMMGVGLLSLSLNSRIFAIRDGSVIAAYRAADAGLTKAIFQMNEKLKVPPWDDSTLPAATDELLSNSNASFSYGVSPNNPYYTVESIGRSGTAERTTYGLLRLKGVAECGVLVQGQMTLKAGTLVDGRDSRYPPDQQPEVHVQIGTASTSSDMIVLNNGVTVNGDVLVGYGGDPDTVIKDLGATVTGVKDSLYEEPYLPSISPPPLPDMGKIDVKGGEKTVGPAGSGYDYVSGRYTRIDLQQHAGSDANLVITGGKVVLHITGDIDLGQGCEIVIRPGASLELYVAGDIKSGTDSGFNNQGSPSDFKLWGIANTGSSQPFQDFQLNANSEYFGQIYAPNAAITVNAKGNLYGAFTAYSFEMKSGGNLFYDGALRDVTFDDEGVRFVLKSWWE